MPDLHNIQIAASIAQLWKHHNQLKGDITIEDAIVMHLHAKTPRYKMHWHNHVLTLEPLVSSLYAGTLTGMIQVEPDPSALNGVGIFN